MAYLMGAVLLSFAVMVVLGSVASTMLAGACADEEGATAPRYSTEVTPTINFTCGYPFPSQFLLSNKPCRIIKQGLPRGPSRNSLCTKKES